jgi:hypothetical protein
MTGSSQFPTSTAAWTRHASEAKSGDINHHSPIDVRCHFTFTFTSPFALRENLRGFLLSNWNLRLSTNLNNYSHSRKFMLQFESWDIHTRSRVLDFRGVKQGLEVNLNIGDCSKISISLRQ